MKRHCALLLALAIACPPAWGQGRAWHRKNRPAYDASKTRTRSASGPTEAPRETERERKERDERERLYGRVERGPMRVLIRTRGTVRSEEVFRLKSSIEGRIEEVPAKPRQWFAGGKRLVTLLNKEYAALMDARATTPSEIVEERWQRVYQPTPVRCEDWCFILKVYARPRAWVQPEALLIEGARKLRLVGRIRSGDGKWIEKGQLLTYWPRSNPKKRQQIRIERFVLDTQGMDVDSGGTFTALLDHRHYLNPGTEWEGVIEAERKNKALKVPTGSLIRVGDQVFLPVLVSTGITTHDYTEITAGVEENRLYLKMDEAKRGALETHAPAPAVLTPRKQQARERKIRRGRRRAAPPPGPAPRRRKRVVPPPIDAFPELIPEEKNDDRFPSDIQ